VILFMLTRPRGITIRDVVMLPTNFDLQAVQGRAFLEVEKQKALIPPRLVAGREALCGPLRTTSWRSRSLSRAAPKLVFRCLVRVRQPVRRQLAPFAGRFFKGARLRGFGVDLDKSAASTNCT
jgi:hypothetical protein